MTDNVNDLLSVLGNCSQVWLHATKLLLEFRDLNVKILLIVNVGSDLLRS